MEQPSSKALFTPAKTQRASEAIYNQIYPKIISGELRPGDRLPPERELAEMFQRSRPVVREALRMLQQEGLIETAVGSSGGAVLAAVWAAFIVWTFAPPELPLFVDPETGLRGIR